MHTLREGDFPAYKCRGSGRRCTPSTLALLHSTLTAIYTYRSPSVQTVVVFDAIRSELCFVGRRVLDFLFQV